MKTTIISLMLLLFPIYSAIIAQQWSWVNPYPTGEQINQCYFLNEQNGFAIGNFGTLLRTIDRGTTWELSETSINGDLIKIIFNDNLNGWILGKSIDPYYNTTPLFLKTTDGGATWQQYTITSFTINLTDMFFLNNNIGWCIGDNGKLFKTMDGGISWTDKSLPQMYSAYFRSIMFKNESDGFISGYDTYLYPSRFIIGYSIDGGDSWDLKYSPLNMEGYDFKTDFTLDSIFITVGYNGLILRSKDECLSWSFCMNNPIEELHSLDFLNNGMGIAGADSGSFLKSNDGGLSWTKNSTGYFATLNSVQCASESFLTASGIGGSYSSTYPYILTSTDAGITWDNHTRVITNPINIYGIDVRDSLSAYICGNYDYSTNYIYKTSDGGLNWQQSYSSSMNGINDIKSFDYSTIFACGVQNYYQGLILKSTDSGQNWETQLLSSVYSINQLSLPDSHAIYALTDEKVIKSTNMGSSWSTIYQPSYPSFRDIEFISADVGYVVGGYYPSNLYKTTNGGVNWNIYTLSSNADINSINFPSENVGYACGYNSIYKTTNGGASWTQIPISNVYSFYDIVFNDEYNGWVIGNNGIYHTVNGGLSWVMEFAKSDYSFNTFGISKLQSLWAAGEGCKIIKYRGDLSTSVSFNQNDLLPTEYALLQNFPNPFNPLTKIRYDIPKASQVSLKVYDILGAEVTTLVNEFLQPGRYTTEWNATRFASGVYIYSLQAGDFVQNKKMILMK